MTYVVSDIHGNYEKFKSLLKVINLKDSDVLYVLGDVVDYGEDSIKLINDISMRYNVLPILGEHDFKAFKYLSAIDKMLREGDMPDAETLSEMTAWVADGGQKTVEDFKELDEEEREGVLDYLSDMSLYEEVEAGGKTFLLVHAGIADFDEDLDLDDCMPEDFISEPIDTARVYYKDKTIIFGHTPTYEIEGGKNGKIFHSGNNSIAIDCGAAYDEPLGCLCLETLEEYYV
ncbi:MAG: metallophosphoesterase [Clostridia bacterium]|nr:metallophosphoesterase [Clostridia bacterium]